MEEEPDYQAMIELYMQENILQFEDFDPELDDFKPIFMIGPCPPEPAEEQVEPTSEVGK
jgi:hypothetical protein